MNFYIGNHHPLKVSQFAELYKYGKTRKSGHLAFKYKRKIYSTVSNNKNYRNLSPKCPTRMAFRALYSTENWESYNPYIITKKHSLCRSYHSN